MCLDKRAHYTMTTNSFGTSCISNISVLVMMPGKSRPGIGGTNGVEPVAMINLP